MPVKSLPVFASLEIPPELPGWITGTVLVVFLIIGLRLGKIFWHRAKKQAVLIELSTRNLQSEYDLAARDIIKVRQDAMAELEAIDRNKPEGHLSHGG